MKLYDSGVYLVNGHDIVEEGSMNQPVSREEAARNTMAYGILEAHNTSGNMEKLQIKFDKLTSHDITFVGIIQTARASGLEKFPVPYVLTNCHNSLCAVGGTINEDDHMFGLTCAKKYGGVYVPPHQAVIHQFAREMLACCTASCWAFAELQYNAPEAAAGRCSLRWTLQPLPRDQTLKIDPDPSLLLICKAGQAFCRPTLLRACYLPALPPIVAATNPIYRRHSAI